MSKTRRKVLVQFMDSRMHVEMVELTTEVRMTGGYGTEGFETDLAAVELFARARLAASEIPPDDYSVVGVLAAVTQGMNAGRIVWVRQAEQLVGAPTW